MKKAVIATLGILSFTSPLMANDFGDIVGEIITSEIERSRTRGNQETSEAWNRAESKSALQSFCAERRNPKRCMRRNRRKLEEQKALYDSPTLALLHALKDLRQQERDGNDLPPTRPVPQPPVQPPVQPPMPQGEFVEVFSGYDCKYSNAAFVINDLNLNNYQSKYNTCSNVSAQYQTQDSLMRSVKINGVCTNIQPQTQVMDMCMNLSLNLQEYNPSLEVTLFGGSSLTGCSYRGTRRGRTFNVSINPNDNNHLLQDVMSYQAQYYSDKNPSDISITEVLVNGTCFKIKEIIPGAPGASLLIDNDTEVKNAFPAIIQFVEGLDPDTY